MAHANDQEPVADDRDEGQRPVAQNPNRGCGHLKHGKGYIRSAPDALDLPAFVEMEPRLPFKEGHFRGYRHFPGMKFEMAVMDRVDFFPRSVVRSDFGRMYGIADGDHMGAMDVSQAQDLIMWVGKTYYDPDDFIEEVMKLGLSKAIPLSTNQGPPTIVPGWTRCWCLHGEAIDGKRPGLLGYAPIGEVIYTKPEDGLVPQWVQDEEAADNVVVATVGDEVSAEATTNHALGDYDGFTLPDDIADEPRNKTLRDVADTVDEADSDAQSEPEAVSVQASDKPGRDVETADSDDTAGEADDA